MVGHVTRISVVMALFTGTGVAAEAVAVLQPNQRDAQAMSESLFRGDYETLLSYTHPIVIEMMGGPEKARTTLKEFAPRIKGITVESFTFPRPPEFVEGGGRHFVVVPTLTVLSLGDQRVESLNYQFGVRDENSGTWKYIEGSRINKQNVQNLFPGFPQDYEFPAFYRKKL